MAKMNDLPKQCESCPSVKKGIFCSLEHGELAELSDRKVTNGYKKGQTLFVQGNPPFGMYCVSQGQYKNHSSGKRWKRKHCSHRHCGGCLGHRSLFTEQYYNATATALDEAKVCFIDKKYIMKLVQEKPTVASNLLGKLGRDLGRCRKKDVLITPRRNVRERLAEFLLLIKESHGVETDDGIFLDIKLTRERKWPPLSERQAKHLFVLCLN